MYPNKLHLYSQVKLAVIAFSSMLCFFSSCEKDPEPISTNSTITGTLYVNDITISELPAVKIVADGPYGSTSTYSDKDGKFWFYNMGNGTYTVECSLAGYGSIKQYGIQVFGNDTAWVPFGTLYLSPAANSKAPEITNVQVNDAYYIILSTNQTDCQTNAKPVRFFLSTDSKVSCDNFEATVIAVTDWQCNYWLNSNFWYVHYNPFKSGEKIYVTGYICNEMDNGYLDTYYNKLVFSSLVKKSKSNTASFIMP